ncbi:hypothetical protein KFE25_011948 [Diacronema lutheri]|uniref:Uncharacterized protein n=2 Tax=Diacronema lutheri TaxID=2081491 RepID=A0A8J5X451_DIALT|nr:hypothetical protein KFE25_011948 [Diacronema lutheri]
MAAEGGAARGVADLRPGDRNVHARLVIVERLNGPVETADGRRVTAFRAADETAAVELAVRGRAGEVFAPGDAVVLRGGHVGLYRGRAVLYGAPLRVSRAPTPFRLCPDLSAPQTAWAYDEATGRWQPAGQRTGTSAADVATHLARRAPPVPAPAAPQAVGSGAAGGSERARARPPTPSPVAGARGGKRARRA